MQNKAFRRFAAAWSLALFAVCGGASAGAADLKPDRMPGATRSVVAVASTSEKSTTAIGVANSRGMSKPPAAATVTEAHPMPTLNGFSLLILAASLGVAALLIWRNRQ